MIHRKFTAKTCVCLPSCFSITKRFITMLSRSCFIFCASAIVAAATSLAIFQKKKSRRTSIISLVCSVCHLISDTATANCWLHFRTNCRRKSRRSARQRSRCLIWACCRIARIGLRCCWKRCAHIAATWASKTSRWWPQSKQKTSFGEAIERNTTFTALRLIFNAAHYSICNWSSIGKVNILFRWRPKSSKIIWRGRRANSACTTSVCCCGFALWLTD